MADLVTRSFGAGLMAVGTAFLVHRKRALADLEAAKTWHATKGRIVSSVVQKGPGSSARYSARITYAYDVGGERRHSKCVTLGGEISGARKRAVRPSR